MRDGCEDNVVRSTNDARVISSVLGNDFYTTRMKHIGQCILSWLHQCHVDFTLQGPENRGKQ